MSFWSMFTCAKQHDIAVFKLCAWTSMKAHYFFGRRRFMQQPPCHIHRFTHRNEVMHWWCTQKWCSHVISYVILSTLCSDRGSSPKNKMVVGMATDSAWAAAGRIQFRVSIVDLSQVQRYPQLKEASCLQWSIQVKKAARKINNLHCQWFFDPTSDFNSISKLRPLLAERQT